MGEDVVALAETVRREVGHIARGCRSAQSHDPSPHEKTIVDALDAAESKLAALRDALAFYADLGNYEERGTGSQDTFGNFSSTECPIWDDMGETARSVLA